MAECSQTQGGQPPNPGPIFHAGLPPLGQNFLGLLEYLEVLWVSCERAAWRVRPSAEPSAHMEGSLEGLLSLTGQSYSAILHVLAPEAPKRPGNTDTLESTERSEHTTQRHHSVYSVTAIPERLLNQTGNKFSKQAKMVPCNS